MTIQEKALSRKLEDARSALQVIMIASQEMITEGGTFDLKEVAELCRKTLQKIE